MDTYQRSIAKTLSWRICATTITVLVALAVTREIRFAATIGVLDTLLKLGTYYGHERLWNRIPMGQVKPPATRSLDNARRKDGTDRDSRGHPGPG